MMTGAKGKEALGFVMNARKRQQSSGKEKAGERNLRPRRSAKDAC